MINLLTKAFWKAEGTMSKDLANICLRFRRKITPWKAKIALLEELSNTDVISDTGSVFALIYSNNTTVGIFAFFFFF